MTFPKYQHTPPEIMLVLHLFARHHLSYILFKCEHIFEGQNKNLDILFETEKDYERAAILLEEKGFVVRLSEKVEKYKTMCTGFIQDTPYSIHLHREIAWHGMIALDKQPVFQHARQVHPLVKIPHLEDSILIHAAHVLFENFKVTGKEEKYLAQIPSVDTKYLRQQARQHHWSYGFQKMKESPGGEISKLVVGLAWFQKLMHEPMTTLYLGKKWIKMMGRTLFPKKQGTLIALIGVNGTGKTTLAKKTLERYASYNQHLGYAQHYYYFGWNPELFLTRIASRILQRQNKSIFSSAALKQSVPARFNLFQETLFLIIFCEFYYRYLIHIYPQLHRKGLVITDRYFYDMCGQYPYATKSMLMKILLRLFPKPDYTFLLNATAPILRNRSKENRLVEEISPVPRKVLPQEYLTQQLENYSMLSNRLHLIALNTEQAPAACADQIIAQTWRKIL